MSLVKLIATTSLFAISLQVTGHATPPPGADLNSPEAHWVQSLKMNGSSVSCCSLADCRQVEYRFDKEGIQAQVNDNWVKVPADRILKRENPTGHAWVCYDQTSNPLTPDRIFCFVGLDLF